MRINKMIFVNINTDLPVVVIIFFFNKLHFPFQWIGLKWQVKREL